MSRLSALAEWNRRFRDKRDYTVRYRYIALGDKYDLHAALDLEVSSLGIQVLIGDSAKAFDASRAIAVVIWKGLSKNPTPQELDELKSYLRTVNERISERACQLRHRGQAFKRNQVVLPMPLLKAKWLEPIVLFSPSPAKTAAVVSDLHSWDGSELNGGEGPI